MGVSSPFLDRIAEAVLVADGGIGTLLHEKGISFSTCFDNLCIENPELIRGIHTDYINAGADVIETNSFGANAVRLRNFNLDGKTEIINREAARIARSAREAMGRDVLIAGSMGPTGRRLVRIDPLKEDDIYAGFRRQAEGLLEGGVDLFILETFADLHEIMIALRAVRSLSKLPVVAQMTFSYDGLTHLGLTAEEIAGKLDACDVQVIGANCSVGPQPMLDVIHQMARVATKPLAAMPNAGLPRYIEGRYLYYTTPEYFSSCAPEFIKYGVRLIGGCCGTTPDHIKKLAEAVRSGIARREGPAYEPLYAAAFSEERPDRPVVLQNRFRERLGSEFVVSVEIDPPRGSNPQRIIKGAEYLAGLGIDAINVADSPMGRVRMGALAAAALVRQAAGIEVILHMTCRDQNLMGLQSTILGSYALGIRNILVITGDPPSGDYPNVTAVYDVDSIGLLEIIKSLNEGVCITGARIGYPTDIVAGTAVNPHAPDMRKELDRLGRKVDAGAAYCMSQPVFDVDMLRRFVDKVAGFNLPVIMGVLPLHSLRHALFLHNEVPGIVIPTKVLAGIELAGDGAHEKGIEIAAEVVRGGRDYIDGIYLMPSFGRYETIGAVLERMELTKPDKTL